ncbi:MAG: carbohydrate-binding protein [Moraxellaceae bacterium]|nr:MAG: carbohydrate-binding protein [Moraxellaceae bacterium]
MLSTIRTEMGNTGSSSSSSSTNGGSCPAWVEGRQYNVGDKVSYQGGYYIAEFANPGYNPTISTYFWEPVAASACGSTSSSSSSTAAFTRLIQAEAYASMSGVQLETTRDTGLGQNVGWIDTADWMSYTNINIPTSGSYRIEYRVASINGGTLAANLNTNAIQFPAVSFSGTGDWQNWTTVSQTVNINAGNYTFGVYASVGGWNINWIRFTKL